MYNGIYNNLKGENHYNYSSENRIYVLKLQDGMSFWFRPMGDFIDCYVDINGQKGPNQIGVDLHNFLLRNDENHFKPEHAENDCNSNGYGWGCAEYILLNGKADYLD